MPPPPYGYLNRLQIFIQNITGNSDENCPEAISNRVNTSTFTTTGTIPYRCQYLLRMSECIEQLLVIQQIA